MPEISLPSDLSSDLHHSSSSTNSQTQYHRRNGTDPDAQEMVIASLRSQVQDLFSQVSQLNGKLVQSYDRVSDLEDDLHVASSNIRNFSLKISELELERTQHLSALNTGLLVEKSHVTAELTRLMEKATEEAAQRGQAESARADIEKDLDDLSATLFGQANTMVAEARYARALSERKVDQAEQALKGAEEAVGLMQQQMQGLQAAKEAAEKEVQEMALVMGKGKWVDRPNAGAVDRPIRLMSSHPPYQEFLSFVAHLRSIHPVSPIPAMSTLLPLPFLARLVTEDSEPTVRLDLAPSLNWLSRRSVLSAIHNGQLIIEPVSSASLLQDHNSNIPGLNSSGNNILCALCGVPVFTVPTNHPTRPPNHPFIGGHTHSGSGSSWSTALFKKPTGLTSTFSGRSPQLTPPPVPPQLYPLQVHVFRLASSPTPVTSALSIHSLPFSSPNHSSSTVPSGSSNHPQNLANALSPNPNTQPSTIYPLCANNWCLTRLRATCSLWAFVRAGIVDKVWEEELPSLPTRPGTPVLSSGNLPDKPPPVPPRKRGIWGMASALGSRAASWGESEKEKPELNQNVVNKQLPTPPKPQPTTEKSRFSAPPPPPTHPDVAAAHAKIPPVQVHSVPPPLPRRAENRNRVSPPTSEKANLPEVTRPTSIPSLPPRLRSPKPLRPTSPSSIPLPDSRPATPIPFSSDLMTRASSPALGAAPPPLPRRAAARAPRPIPASRPATAEGGESPPSVGQGLTADTTATADIVHPGSTSTSHAPLQVEVSTAEVSTTTVETVDAQKEDISTVVTPVTAVESRPITPQLTSPSTEELFVDAEDLTTPVKTEATNVEVTPDLGTVKEGRPEDAVVDGNETDVKDDATLQVEGKDDETLSEKVKEEADPQDREVYVGDATWEERVWKELVRLREDMLWARIGGLR